MKSLPPARRSPSHRRDCISELSQIDGLVQSIGDLDRGCVALVI
jgi:hypothetical protein